MAWLFEKSSTWRKIVAVTKQNPLAMAGFTAVCFGAPWYLGKFTMNATNPEIQAEQQVKLQRKASLHQKATSRANKERLAVLLEETRRGSGDERYAAALSLADRSSQQNVAPGVKAWERTEEGPLWECEVTQAKINAD